MSKFVKYDAAVLLLAGDLVQRAEIDRGLRTGGLERLRADEGPGTLRSEREADVRVVEVGIEFEAEVRVLDPARGILRDFLPKVGRAVQKVDLDGLAVGPQRPGDLVRLDQLDLGGIAGATRGTDLLD